MFSGALSIFNQFVYGFAIELDEFLIFLDINPLWDIYSLQSIFFHFIDCLFIWLIISFAVLASLFNKKY